MIIFHAVGCVIIKNSLKISSCVARILVVTNWGFYDWILRDKRVDKIYVVDGSLIDEQID